MDWQFIGFVALLVIAGVCNIARHVIENEQKAKHGTNQTCSSKN